MDSKKKLSIPEKTMLEAKNFTLQNQLLQVYYNEIEYLEKNTDVKNSNQTNQEQIKAQQANYLADIEMSGAASAKPKNSKETEQTTQQIVNKVEAINDRPISILDMFVDAKDNMNNWCVAKILEYDQQQQQILISFDAWSMRCNESNCFWVRVESSPAVSARTQSIGFQTTARIQSMRLAPFRRHSGGYIIQRGNQMQNDLRPNYAYMEIIQDKIQNIIDSDFMCFQDANQCNQFIRGELYFFYDGLMSFTPECTQADLSKLHSFTKSVLKLFEKWLILFPDYVELYKMNKQVVNLYNVDLKAAIANCWQELFDMATRSIGLDLRTKKFAYKFDKTGFTYVTQYFTEKSLNEKKFFYSLYGQFAELQLFDKLLDLIDSEKVDQKFICPPEIVAFAIRPLKTLKDVAIVPQFSKQWILRANELVLKYLSPGYLNSTEMKDMHMEDLKQVILFNALLLSPNIEAYKFIEYQGLEMAKRFLTSPYFEKRIRGLQELKMMKERVVYRSLVEAGKLDAQKTDFSTYLTKETYADWIIENKIIEFIFTENPHSELIKRTLNIFQLFEDMENYFPEYFIDIIWSCCSPEKHEDIIRATFELLTDLSRYLPLDRIEKLFKKIEASIFGASQIPQNDTQKTNEQLQTLAQDSGSADYNLPSICLDEKTITFIRDFSISCIENIKRQKRKLENQQAVKQNTQNKVKDNRVQSAAKSVQEKKELLANGRFFDPMILWRAAQSNSMQSNQKLRDLAQQSLIEVLKIAGTYIPTIKQEYIQLGLQNIKEGKLFHQSLIFIQNLLETYPNDDQQMSTGYSQVGGRKKNSTARNNISEASVETLIGDLLKKQDLYSVLINQADKYMQSYKERKKEAITRPQTAAERQYYPQLSSRQTFFPKEQTVSHEEIIKAIMSLIEFVVMNSRSATLQYSHIECMFKIFVTQAVSEVETRAFFDFLTKQNPNAKNQNRLFLLDQDLRFQVFGQIMCNDQAMNCLNLNFQAYECFHTLLLGVNAQSNSLVIQGDEITQINDFDNIQGLNTMWDIARFCQDETVRNRCRNDMCDIYQMVESGKNQQKVKINTLFMRNCCKYLEQALKERHESNKHNKTIENCLQLMKTFILRYDKVYLIPELKQFVQNLNANQQKDTRKIKIILMPDGIRSEVELNMNCKFWELIRIISNSVGCKMSEIQIVAKEGPVRNTIYNGIMRDFNFQELNLERVQQDKIRTEHPSYILGQDKECIKNLLACLDKQTNPNSIIQETVLLFEMIHCSQAKKEEIAQKINKLIALVDIKKNNKETEASSKTSKQSSQIQNSQSPDQGNQINLNQEEWAQILKFSIEQPQQKGVAQIDLSQTFYSLNCIREMVTKSNKKQPIQMENYRIIKYEDTDKVTEFKKAQDKEKKNCQILQQQIINKGGLQFLAQMFKQVRSMKQNQEDVQMKEEAIDENQSLEDDILRAKIINMQITILNELFSIQNLQNSAPKNELISELVHGSTLIVKDILETHKNKEIINFNNLLAKIQPVQQDNKRNVKDDVSMEDAIEKHANFIEKQNRASAFQAICSQEHDIKLLNSLLKFISRLLEISPLIAYNSLKSNELLESILKIGLVEVSSPLIQRELSEFINFLCKNIEEKINEEVDNKALQDTKALQGQPPQPGKKVTEQKVKKELPSFLVMKCFIIDLFPIAFDQEFSEKMRYFMNCANYVLLNGLVGNQVSNIKGANILFNELFDEVQKRVGRELSSRDEDIVLGGIFDFLGKFFIFNNEYRANIKNKKEIVQFLTHEGLFRKEHRLFPLPSTSENQNLQNIGTKDELDSGLYPICKNQNTRLSCLELLRTLLIDDQKTKQFFCDYLLNQIGLGKESYWRTPNLSDWQVQLQAQERALCGYAGLKNPSCICYMNSILQQLFMIPTFRKLLLEAPEAQVQSSTREEDTLFQLKCLFGGLLMTEKQYYNPKRFLQSFKDFDGEPVDPNVQKDVDEFFNMLMDRLEGLLGKDTPTDKQMKNLFQGVLANEFICKDCPHYSEREEPFLAISLQVKNKTSVQDSLKYYVEGEMLEGDNAYFCEKCEKKVNTLKRCCIKRMPNVLFLVLKRFEFDFDTMQKVKLNDYCEFPHQLDMSPYSQQELARADLIKQMEAKNWSEDDLNEEQLHTLKRKVPQAYYNYNLRGIVVHYGYADQGHYYSFIKEKSVDNKKTSSSLSDLLPQDFEEEEEQKDLLQQEKGVWFEFNDTIVREFDPSEIQEEAFGGEDNNLNSTLLELQNQNDGQIDPQMQMMMRKMKTKIKNAYVLIYDREVMFNINKVNDLMDDSKTITLSNENLHQAYLQSIIETGENEQIQAIPFEIQEIVQHKNKKFWFNQSLFNDNFISKVYDMFIDIKIDQDQNYNKYAAICLQTDQSKDAFQTFKFFIAFYLAVAARSKDRSLIKKYVLHLRQVLASNIGLSMWLIETISNQEYMREFIIDCPLIELSGLINSLLEVAMLTVYDHEKQAISEYIKNMETHEQLYAYLQNDCFTNGQASPTQIIEQSYIDGTQKGSRADWKDLDESLYSGCTNILFLKINGHKPKLPKLIVLINSVIHMSTSHYLLSKQKFSCALWRVFDNFARLGTEARLYLLKTKTLGRFLDIFLNYQNYDQCSFTEQECLKFQKQFRDEELREKVPLFQIVKEYYLPIESQSVQIQMNSIDKKIINLQMVIYQTFIVSTISYLLRSVPLKAESGKNNFEVDTITEYKLCPIELILLNDYKNQRWYQYHFPAFVRQHIANILAYISFENQNISWDIIDLLTDNLYYEQSNGLIRNLARTFVAQVQINDSLKTERIEYLIKKLGIQYQSNERNLFWLQHEYTLHLTTQMAVRSTEFADQFKENNKALYQMIAKYNDSRKQAPLQQLMTKSGMFLESKKRWVEFKQGYYNVTSKYFNYFLIHVLELQGLRDTCKNCYIPALILAIKSEQKADSHKLAMQYLEDDEFDAGSDIITAPMLGPKQSEQNKRADYINEKRHSDEKQVKEGLIEELEIDRMVYDLVLPI